MPIIIAGAAFIAALLTYFVFAMPARKKLNNQLEDLKAAKALLDEAQTEREQLKQQLADTQYKLKETEKDLDFIKSQSK